MTTTIKTNHQPRNPLYGYELTPAERAEFDYIQSEEMDTHEFMRYKGMLYDLSEFMTVGGAPELKGWDGYAGDSYFSGVVIKYTDGGRVIAGTYYC